VYSTLLWHLQRTVQLSFLAQELLSIDPRSSQAWIAIGNTFSMQKERSQALTCFRRAQQLDPTCAYAFTLAGHEFIDEDLDKAILSFQMALRADARHYNAWYVQPDYFRELALMPRAPLGVTQRLSCACVSMQVWPRNLLSKKKQNSYGGVSLSESCGDPPQQCGVVGLRRHGVYFWGAEQALDCICVALTRNAQ
jgi:tetratricopeptide (TPR) repeat protein